MRREGLPILVVQATTDRGLRRESNQDSFACWISEDAAERDRYGALLVVADGMGGAKGGDVASRQAVDTLVRVYREATDADLLKSLTHAVAQANLAVHEESLSDPDLTGMGTTCTAAVVRDSDLFLAHVGDSRAYLVTSGFIRQLTRDHSLVAHLVEQRTLTPEEARVDPRRNLVTRSLGLAPEVEIDTVALADALGHGETLLICSDGLHGPITDQELRETVAGRDLDVACRDLVALANEAGGPDNITVILARLDDGGGRRELRRTASAAEEPGDEESGEGELEREREREPEDQPEPEDQGPPEMQAPDRKPPEQNPQGERELMERGPLDRPGLARHRRRIPIPGWLIVASIVLLVLIIFSVLGVMLVHASGRP